MKFLAPLWFHAMSCSYFSFFQRIAQKICSFNRLSMCEKVTISRTLIYSKQLKPMSNRVISLFCHRIQNSSHEWIWQCRDKYSNFRQSVLHSQRVYKASSSTGLHVFGWDRGIKVHMLMKNDEVLKLSTITRSLLVNELTEMKPQAFDETNNFLEYDLFFLVSTANISANWWENRMLRMLRML